MHGALNLHIWQMGLSLRLGIPKPTEPEGPKNDPEGKYATASYLVRKLQDASAALLAFVQKMLVSEAFRDYDDTSFFVF